MKKSYSKANFHTTFPDISGGTEFYKHPEKYTIEIRKVDDENYKVDVELKKEAEEEMYPKLANICLCGEKGNHICSTYHGESTGKENITT